MGLRIQNNIDAFNTHRQLQLSSAAASSSMEKLSSGYRINRAADDAAGLAISEQMRGQIGGLDQAQRNAQDGVSLVQTAEGALNEVHSMLQRLRDLKVQFNNGTLDSDDQDAISAEVYQIGQELGNIGSQTEFNGNALLGGLGTLAACASAMARGTVRTGMLSTPRARTARDTGRSRGDGTPGHGARTSRRCRSRVITPGAGETFVPPVHTRHNRFPRTTTVEFAIPSPVQPMAPGPTWPERRGPLGAARSALG